MKTSYFYLTILLITFIIGLLCYVKSHEVRGPSSALKISPIEHNKLRSEMNYQNWGPLIKYERIKDRSIKNERVLQIWLKAAGWTGMKFLELQFKPEKLISVKYSYYSGTPDKAKEIKKKEFQIRGKKVALINSVLKEEGFWGANDKAPTFEYSGGNWCFIEGSDGRKITRWTSRIGDDSSENAKILAEKIYGMLKPNL